MSTVIGLSMNEACSSLSLLVNEDISDSTTISQSPILDVTYLYALQSKGVYQRNPPSVLTQKSWTISYDKDLVLYGTGLSPFNFALIRLLDAY